jgi:hypothetical protein
VSTGHLPPRLRRLARLAARIEARWKKASAGDPDPPRADATLLGWATWAAAGSSDLAVAPAVIERYYGARFGAQAADEDLERALAGLLRASRRLRPHSASTGQKRSVE